MIGSINNEQIKQIIDAADKSGFKIGMRDIAYVFLCKSFEDVSSAYRCIFGADREYNQSNVYSYDATGAIEYIRNYIETTFASEKKRKPRLGDITFEENKAEIIKLIQTTKEALASGEIEAKDALKIEADLRIKLNDKFQVKEEVKDQYVHVFQKYNDVCPYCSHEIARREMTKEDAMKKYNLIENK